MGQRRQPSTSTGPPIGPEFLGEDLARDVARSLREALRVGVVFPRGRGPKALFREAVAAASRAIESGQGTLLQRLVEPGPYEGLGEIPEELRDQRMSDEETATAIRFVYGHMVNCFKGRLAEMLAAGAAASWLAERRTRGDLPPDARIYAGDAVCPLILGRTSTRLGADLHLLRHRRVDDGESKIEVLGVGEVKSFHAGQERLRRQLGRHLERARAGLRVMGRMYAPARVRFPAGRAGGPVRIGIVPSCWRLPRTFRIERNPRHRPVMDPREPPHGQDQVEEVSPGEWRITLRWSEEALAEAGYRLTFRYMERVGETVYAQGVRKEWSEMTAAEAGTNAMTSALHYAIMRVRSLYEQQRAIALYNVYGFGYALGMNFVDARGCRERLSYEDLEELLGAGRTQSGCTVR